MKSLRKALSFIVALAMVVTVLFTAGINEVNAAKKVKVKSITLSETSLTLTVGEKATLKATVSPTNATNKKVSFTSSKKSVATVNAKGVIKAKKAGKTKITVKAKDGSGKKAVATVTVVKKVKKTKQEKKSSEQEESSQDEEPAPVEESKEEASEEESKEESKVEESSKEEEESKEESKSEESKSEESKKEETPAPVEEKTEEESKEETPEVAYPAFDYEEKVDGTTVTVEVPEGAVPEGTTVKVEKVAIKDVEKSVAKVAEGEIIFAVDITFELKGEKIEPKADSKVKVTMKNKAIAEVENPVVVHVPDEGKPEIVEQVEEETKANEVAFENDQFSVYAVINPGEGGDNARVTVNFYGKDQSTPVATYYVKNSDTAEELVNIVADPNIGTLADNELFRGWTYTKNYTSSTEAIDIDDIRSDLVDMNIKEGDVLDIYAMIYHFFNITYLGEDSRVSLGTDTVLVPVTESSGSYTVNMAYTPTDGTHNFEGWLASEGGSNITGWTEGKTYPNGTPITVSGDVTFSVYAPEGQWLVFHENDGTYVAPQFVKSGETTKAPTVEMKKLGYTFGGWYTDDGTFANEFSFGGTISDRTHVYAKWVANTTAEYVILIWKQNVNDAKNAADSAKTYDFAESITLTGNVGSTINTVTASGTGDGRYATVNGTAKRYTGFHLRTYDTGVTIKTTGNSVLNVYYDRNLVTLNFNTYSNRAWRQYLSYTGLYGSTLESNGYAWPDEYDWYLSYYNNQGTGTRRTFMDAFIPAGVNGMTHEFYARAPSGTANIYFYKQNANLNGYTLANTVSAAANSQFTLNDKYNGFYVKSYSTNGTSYSENVGTPDSSGYYNTVNYGNQLHIRFDRKVFNIVYLDGIYEDGGGNKITSEESQGEWHTVSNIIYGSSLASYNKGGANYYTPTGEKVKDGFIFDGWYVDDQCTQPYTFTTMPEGITVYAKWKQIQYRVFLHPNVPKSDTSLYWGSDDQEMSFRVSYGDKISAPTGTRSDFEFIAWYLDEGFSQLFDADAYVLNETTVTESYDQTEPTELDDHGFKTSDINKDAQNNRYWITKKFNLYANWSAKTPGALGIGVIYDATSEGKNAPTDNLKYKDQADAVAQNASTPNSSDKVFLYWVVQKWNGSAYEDTNVKVYPGDTFKVKKAESREQDIPGATTEDEEYKTYTVQLRAEYGDKETPTPTYINWYKNDEGQTTTPIHEDKDLQINEAVDIYTLESGIPTRDGYTFLGWARESEYEMDGTTPVGDPINHYDGLTEDDLFLKYDADSDSYQAKNASGTWVAVTQVAADERMPYHALYAVWEAKPFYIYHSSDNSIEKILFSDERIVDGKIDLTKEVKSPYYYGGYFDDYADKKLTVDEIKALEFTGTDSNKTRTYGSNGKGTLWDADSEGTAYDGSNTSAWDSANPGSAKGTQLEPAADTVYFLKEVPEGYLRPAYYYVYDSYKKDDEGNFLKPLTQFFLTTVVDDQNYTSVDISVGGDLTKEYKGLTLKSSIVVDKNTKTGTTTKTYTATGIFGNTVKGGYLVLQNTKDDNMIAAQKNYTMNTYFVTLDGVGVTVEGWYELGISMGDASYNSTGLTKTATKKSSITAE